MKTIIYIVIAFICLMNNKSSRAQDFQKLQTAFQQSYSYEYEGNLPKAIESLKSDYQDNSYEINLRLGWLSYLQGLFTEAIAYYQKSIDIQPLSIEARFGYIYPAAALNHWEAVKRTYEEILKIDKQNKIANYRLGLIYYNDENYEAASKYLQNVINLYPFDYDGLLMFAWTNLKSGKFREAKILFNKVLLYQPNDKSALEGLSMIK